MDYFSYKAGTLSCESVSLSELASKVGTPAYVYSKATLHRHCQNLQDAFSAYPTLSCFAVKANSNLSVLKEVAQLGFGADVVSGGELERALLAGIPANKIVYSGVGKQETEIERALEAGILSFNVESLGELELIARVANKRGCQADVSPRINPNVGANTNPYVATGLYSTKFGIAEKDLTSFLDIVSQNKSIQLVGLSCHIGSQITELDPFRSAVLRMVELATQLVEKGHPLKILDLGGGLGIRYQDEAPPSLADYAKTLIDEVKKTGLTLLIEPGRVVVGNAGILLTKVLFVKKTPAKTFVIVDAAMNDLIRPSMYKSFHKICPVTDRTGNSKMQKVDVVGPICETGDFLGLDRELPELKPGELLVVRGCGAYSATMASNYNSRPRAPEVLVDGESYKVVRRREKLEMLWANEEKLCTRR